MFTGPENKDVKVTEEASAGRDAKKSAGKDAGGGAVFGELTKKNLQKIFPNTAYGMKDNRKNRAGLPNRTKEECIEHVLKQYRKYGPHCWGVLRFNSFMGDEQRWRNLARVVLETSTVALLCMTLLGGKSTSNEMFDENTIVMVPTLIGDPGYDDPTLDSIFGVTACQICLLMQSIQNSKTVWPWMPTEPYHPFPIPRLVMTWDQQDAERADTNAQFLQSVIRCLLGVEKIESRLDYKKLKRPTQHDIFKDAFFSLSVEDQMTAFQHLDIVFVHHKKKCDCNQCHCSYSYKRATLCTCGKPHGYPFNVRTRMQAFDGIIPPPYNSIPSRLSLRDVYHVEMNAPYRSDKSVHTFGSGSGSIKSDDEV